MNVYTAPHPPAFFRSGSLTLCQPSDVTSFHVGHVLVFSGGTRHGATRATLLNRARYGGRKGRRARVRLDRREYSTQGSRALVTGVDHSAGTLTIAE